MQKPQINPKILSKDGLIVEDVAYIPILGPSKEENFRSPSAYVFLFFEQAKGTHTIDFVEYKDEDFQTHISFPGQVHS